MTKLAQAAKKKKEKGGQMNNKTATGSSLSCYLNWIATELQKKEFGEVSINFVVRDGTIVDVRKESVDREHFSKTIQ